jgi:uncharacterized cupin superfamily protein
MCAFEGFDAPFSQLGINVRVLTQESGGLYHSETNQEDFLVVAGECLLLVADEERPLKAWDSCTVLRGQSTPSSSWA